jgi:hypothetical protein
MVKQPEPRGTVRLTKLSVLLAALVVAALVVWLLLLALDTAGLPLPYVPVLVPVVLGLIAAGVALGALATWRAINVKNELIEPKSAIQRLALGKASSLAGAVIAGCYLAMALYSFTSGISAPSRFWRGLSAAIAAITALALAVAGYVLELACRVPPDDEDDNAAVA